MSNQSHVAAWTCGTFGEESASNIRERCLRVVEEVVELAQACDVDARTCQRLVDYVFSRPAGKPAQEIAGCMITLYAAASALDVDADAELEVELVRVQRPEVVERCRRRQSEKRAALGSAPATPLWTVIGLYEPGKYVRRTFVCYVACESASDAKKFAVEKNAARGDRVDVIAVVAGGGVAVTFEPEEERALVGEV